MPRLAAVGRRGHHCIRTTDSTAGHGTTRHCEVDTPRIVDADGWILKVGVSAGLTRCVLNRAYVPRYAVVFRDHRGASSTAPVLGKLHRPARCAAYVAC